MIFRLRAKLRARHVLESLNGALPDGGWMLDLGCGRGFVGALLNRRRGCEVVGCDVVPANEALDRFCRFDGRHLPFRFGTFDAAILAFVLHHARKPAAVLAEAARVVSGPVLILEDTPRRWLDRVWGALHVWFYAWKSGLPWTGRERSRREWLRLFRRVGLEITGITAIGRLERFPPVSRTAFVCRTRAPAAP